MSERRTEKRAESSDRRDIRRPSLRLNLILLLAAVVAILFAGYHRQRIDADFTRVLNKSAAGPSELDQITIELAEMNLAKGTLEKELENRLAYIESLKSQDFYLSIDTANKTLSLKSGNETVREAKIEIGAPASGKGAFTVAGKKKGPGLYSILLPKGRAIHSAPALAGSLKGPKSGSFMASEADLQAIWGQITPRTRVYIF